MQRIILNSSKVKAYECLHRLGEYTGKRKEWIENLWKELLYCDEIYDEFIYYLEHQEFLGTFKIEGYTILDVFIWELDHFNVLYDATKRGKQKNKISMVLKAFEFMLKMNKNPEYVKKLEADLGKEME